jgi:hypothetical protein
MNQALAPVHDDLDDVAIPTVVKIAGGAAMATGAFTLAVAAQTALIFRMAGAMPLVVAAMAALGTLGVVAGFATLRGSGRAAVGATATGALVATLGLAWAVVGLLSGLLSPLTWGIVPCGVATAGVGVLAIAPARKVSRARAALRARGLDFGL